MKWLYLLLSNLLGNAGARVLAGAGMAIVTFGTMLPLVLAALNAAAAGFAGISGDILAVANMAGVGESLSLLGSAMMTRTAINAATVGIKKAGTAA